jgi:hypothetical protein
MNTDWEWDSEYLGKNTRNFTYRWKLKILRWLRFPLQPWDY